MIARALLVVTLAFALLTAAGARPAASQEPDAEAIARAYLAQSRLVPLPEQAQGLGPAQRSQAASAAPPAERDLDHVDTQQSRGARHVRFQETEDGVPIFGAHVVVNISRDDDEVGFVSDRRTGAPVASSAQRLDGDEAVDIAIDAGGVVELRGNPGAELTYYEVDGALYLAWQVLIPALDPLGDWLVIVLAEDGDVELVTNVMRLDSGRVFDPNPGQQSVSHCDSSTNENIVDDEYVTRTLLGIDSGQDLLRGEYVDLTAPGIVGAYKADGQAGSASHTYVYDCNDDRFEEVMVYYHVDTAQRKLQSLGFTGASAILDEPIPAHAHYYVDCNAFYSPVDTGLHFGDCGTNGHDAAEDGDVIVHEYGHAVQDDQVPGWGFGDPLVAEQARGMGEGFGDFLAAAMAGNPCIAEWSNFGQTTCGGAKGLRYLQNNKDWSDFDNCRFDGPSQPAEEHCTGEIWGAALWDFVEALGGDDDAIDLALTLVVNSHFYLGPQATFDDGVCAIFAADNDLYGGAHGATIANAFSNRGINCTFVPPPDFPYAFLRIRHTAQGNLVIRLKAGSNPNSPDCSILIWNQTGGTTDDVVGFVSLDGTVCEPFLPPSESTPWWLEVQDVVSGNTGTIADFEIALDGTTRCTANNTPLAIPDAGAVVRAMIDCETSGDSINAGLLRVTTNPAVPSQIMVDGVARDSWGLTWVKLIPGTYTVGFSGLEGFSPPASQEITVTEGITTTVNGGFTQRGFLRVLTDPAVPATISVDGTPRNDWGMWTDLPPGTYEVCYGAVADYQPPPCENAVITAANTTTVTGEYAESPGASGPTDFGMLRVQTSPAVRSQIFVDGVPMDTWGLTWVKLPPGSYTVSFGDVPQFATPAPQTVTVTNGATTTVIGAFQQMGLLQVATSPAVPATIYVDGVARNDWGLWTGFLPGTYQVCYGEVDGFDAPPCRNATVNAGGNTLIQGSYSASGP